MTTNLNFALTDALFKTEEINRCRSKVIQLTEIVLEDPNNASFKALLDLTLLRLEKLQSA